ncbi:MAG TPA: prephenate dehydrogenase/arogenate dehydrogenase family protein [Terriglobales bacterium]|nr:prephenate dehydrogenase/arogenate dehydrogenase family protein [Terriglobales bacterium]
MRVGILGLGLMGSSFALALRRARPDLSLVGDDPDAVTMRRARGLGLVDEGDPRTADVLVLAVPIAAMPEVLAGLAGRRGVVTDMASTKAHVVRWAAAAGVDLVGGHPMCGREQAGIDAADPDIFQGAPWVLTRDEPTVTGLVDAVGSWPVFLDAERHDRLVAGVSHAAFVLSAAYVLALAGDRDWEAMQHVAGSGFRDMSRLAAGDPGLYAAIVSTNRAHLTDALRALEASLARMRRHVEAGDGRLVELFEEARLARERWSRGGKGATPAAGEPRDRR